MLFRSSDLAELVAKVLHWDRLIVRLQSDNADEPSDSQDDRSLTIPWQTDEEGKKRAPRIDLAALHNSNGKISVRFYEAKMASDSRLRRTARASLRLSNASITAISSSKCPDRHADVETPFKI